MQASLHTTPWKLIWQKPNFDTFCGTNNYSTIISFKYNQVYTHFILMSWFMVPILYGFPSVLTSIMVPQKCQYKEKTRPSSKYWPPKSGTRLLKWCCHIYFHQKQQIWKIKNVSLSYLELHLFLFQFWSKYATIAAYIKHRNSVEGQSSPHTIRDSSCYFLCFIPKTPTLKLP